MTSSHFCSQGPLLVSFLFFFISDVNFLVSIHLVLLYLLIMRGITEDQLFTLSNVFDFFFFLLECNHFPSKNTHLGFSTYGEDLCLICYLN